MPEALRGKTQRCGFLVEGISRGAAASTTKKNPQRCAPSTHQFNSLKTV
jgi:hypothetical protein